VLVSHRKKFIFLKTSKTAGTSVEVLFEKYCFPEGAWTFSHYIEEYKNSDTGIVGYRGLSRGNQRFFNHMQANALREELGNDIWDEYFKFTVIRNPFDKMVSAFFHFEKHRKSDKYSSDKLTDVERFRNWVRSGGKIIDKHIYSIAGKVAVDYVIRYENLKNDLAAVCQKLNLDCDLNELPNLKAEFRDRSLPVKAFYDLETEQYVRRLYEFELQQFGYQLD